MRNNSTALASNEFGGEWTEEKLSILTEYLDAYTIALSNQSWCKLVYIDLFSGCGTVNVRNGIVEGSARRALSLERKFRKYFFVEKDPHKAQALREMICEEFPFADACVYTDDANIALRNEILPQINKRTDRGVVFLDPYAMHVQWDTIRAIAASECLDFWYLFPVYAINRNLPKDGEIQSSVAKRLDDALGGSGWYNRFYAERKYRQQSLFEGYTDSDYMKCAAVEDIAKYAIERLETVFPTVLDTPFPLRNSNNATLFYLVFAVSNPSLPAKGLAMRLAKTIFEKHKT